jgi:hypothetical protein
MTPLMVGVLSTQPHLGDVVVGFEEALAGTQKDRAIISRCSSMNPWGRNGSAARCHDDEVTGY